MSQWGITDPFEFLPDEFHFDMLKAVEPFLRVHRGPTALKRNVSNKFEGGKMQKGALDACMHLIGMEVAALERSYNHVAGVELIRLVEKFTIPTDTPTDLSFLPTTGDNHEQNGFFISYADNREQHSASNAEATSCRGFVFNEGPLSAATAEERCNLSPQQCVFVAKFGRREDDDAIAQAAALARPEVIRNLSNRHYEPMHLIALSRSKYTYAVLTVQGYVVAGGQCVTDRAYADFLKTTEPGSNPDSKAVLDELLMSGSTFLRENYRSKSTPCYSERPYIVGDLYVAPKWYMLPSTQVYHGMISPEATAFYEGLLRIVVGDRILKFTVADVVDVAAQRMAQSLQQTAKGGLEPLRMVNALQKQGQLEESVKCKYLGN